MNARYEKSSIAGMGTGDRIKQVRKAARLSQERFADIIGKATGTSITRGAVGNWELGGGISRANLTAISDYFDVPLDWLERGKGADPSVKVPPTGATKDIMSGTRQIRDNADVEAHNAQISGPVAGSARVPIRGRAMGGKRGELIFDDGEFGDTAAHPRVVGVPDAYAVYVIGDSMLERFRHGEIVYVHPYAPYAAEDDVLIQVQASDGEPIYGWVKRFVSQDEKTLRVKQLNPRKVLTFPMSTIVKIHKIVGSGSI